MNDTLHILAVVALCWIGGSVAVVLLNHLALAPRRAERRYRRWERP